MAFSHLRLQVLLDIVEVRHRYVTSDPEEVLVSYRKWRDAKYKRLYRWENPNYVAQDNYARWKRSGSKTPYRPGVRGRPKNAT